MMLTTQPQQTVPEPPPAPPSEPRTRPSLWRALFATARKEIRELAVIATLASISYSAILACLLYVTASRVARNQVQQSWETTALSEGFLYATFVAAALTGLLLGFVQFIPEARVGRRGFMLHRPVSRTTLFLFKAAAGLAVYVVTLGVPLLVALWWASQPRNIPLPFVWKLALVPLAHIAWGVAFYFVGVLVAVRVDARWVGSRLLPLAAPLPATILIALETSFGQSLLHSGLLTLILALPAHAYFAAAGQYGRTRVYARPFTGAVLASGLFAVGAVALGFIVAFLPNRLAVAQLRRSPVILHDGTPAVMDRQDAVITVRDAAGKVLGTVPEGTNILQPGPFRILSTNTGRQTGHFSWDPHSSLCDPQSYFEPYGQTYGTGDWYRATEKAGDDYLVGFDSKNRRLIGAIGAHGFEPGVAVPRTRFPKPFSDAPAVKTIPEAGLATRRSGTQHYTTLFSTGNAVRGLTPAGQFKTLWQAPEEIRYLIALSDSGHQGPTNWVVVTDRAVFVMPPLTGDQPQPTLQYTREDLSDYSVSAAQIPETGQFVMMLEPRQTPVRNLSWGTPASWPLKPTLAVFFNPQGAVAREVELPSRVSYVQWEPPNVMTAWVVPALVPPLARPLLEPLIRPGDPRDVVDNAADLSRDRAIGAGAALAAALAMFFFARRRGLEARAVWLWTLATLLLGALGWVLLLCLRGLPVLTRCHSCHRRLRVDESKCPACGAPAPGPAPNGTEVLASAAPIDTPTPAPLPPVNHLTA